MPESPYQRALDRKLVGLCVSGGGIRSATFALGVLQQLAERGLLSRLDYLSTVSGGGYIGSWLIAWIQRANRAVVEKNIQETENPLSEQSRPVRFLREYSQYLAPQAGALSADLWTLIAIFLRNLVLNQTIILMTLGAILAAPLLMIGPIALARENQNFALGCIISGVVLTVLACLLIRQAAVARGTYGPWRQGRVIGLI